MSRIYSCADDTERAEGIRAAVDAARGGRLVVMPTDTLLEPYEGDAQLPADATASGYRNGDLDGEVKPDAVLDSIAALPDWWVRR